MITNPTVLIADDHPLFRMALVGAVKHSLHTEHILECECVSSLQNKLESEGSVDLILLDLNMPGAQGFSALCYLKSHYADTPVIVVSAHDDPTLIGRALNFGASGFIPKSTSMLTMGEAMKRVILGHIWTPDHINIPNTQADQHESELAERLASLTAHQFRVLTMVSEGLLNKQIASELSVTESTIKAHLTSIFKKLKVRTRIQAVIALQAVDGDYNDAIE